MLSWGRKELSSPASGGGHCAAFHLRKFGAQRIGWQKPRATQSHLSCSFASERQHHTDTCGDRDMNLDYPECAGLGTLEGSSQQVGELASGMGMHLNKA